MSAIKTYDALTGRSKHVLQGTIVHLSEAKNGFAFAQVKLDSGGLLLQVCVKQHEVKAVSTTGLTT